MTEPPDPQMWAYPSPEPPKKKSHKLLWFGAGAAIFVAIVAATGGNDVAPTTSASTVTARPAASSLAPSRTTAATPTIAPAGATVRDGKFEFHVAEVKRMESVGSPTGNPYMTSTAQGEYVVVTMSVQNIGDQAQSYFGDNQMLVGTDGRQYAPDTMAGAWMNSTNGSMSEINPGNYIWVHLAFDVPPGTPTSALVLHDSMFSGGVKVAVA
jgi:hypothetical protein